MFKLAVVVTSTRPGRVGLPIAQWFLEAARAHGKFDVELVDLKEVGLPAIDEPQHPRFQKYEHDHTKAWSARVQAFDAFVFVTPEYNFSMPPALLNALDFLFVEWAYKAAAFVSYGGVSGGTRSVAMAKQVLTSLKIMPIPESVILPFVHNQIDKTNGEFRPLETHQKAAVAMLDELIRWTEALEPLRRPKSKP